MMKLFALTILLLVVAAVLVIFLAPGPVYRGAMQMERWLAGLQTRSVEIDGVRFLYSDGEQGQPLLLLHGFSAERDHWNRVARYLRGQFRVIAPDLPGFGSSSQDSTLDYSIESQVDRLEAFIDQLGLTRLHLGGSSMGGAMAAVYAARHPDRVLSLWLMAPAGVTSGQQSEMEKILLSGAEHPLIPNNRQQFEDTLDFVFMKRPFLPAPVRGYLSRDAIERENLRQQIFDDLLDDGGRAIRTSINDRVKDLAVPTLIVWGDADRVLHPDGAEALRALLTYPTVDIMPGVGHLPMLELPMPTAERYLKFQQGLNPQSPKAAKPVR
ncbi:MAG: alpha/beta fold hydrolase [Gammaproteobacteria bacterium]|nr:alpha/beta fold hydrolase [Gammaproteobacteria bacterium]